ncbi:MAG TPA: hypothetical protein VFN67_36805 [Polyangiales bacterium]|nr:hypothetical protein [Polyangiales bacterium]
MSAIENALENPVAQCEQDQATCLGSAADRTAAAQCGEAFRACLGGAVEIGQQMAEALQQCRDQAAQCAVSGGAMGAEACRTDYESCVSAATADAPQQPAAGAEAPRIPQLPAAGGLAPRLPTAGARSLPGRRLPFAGAGGFGGLPRLPTAGGISLPGAAGRGGLPGRRPGLPSNPCFDTLRMCLEAPNADLNKCSTEARACLRGAGPLGGAGTGGTGGAP